MQSEEYNALDEIFISFLEGKNKTTCKVDIREVHSQTGWIISCCFL